MAGWRWRRFRRDRTIPPSPRGAAAHPARTTALVDLLAIALSAAALLLSVAALRGIYFNFALIIAVISFIGLILAASVVLWLVLRNSQRPRTKRLELKLGFAPNRKKRLAQLADMVASAVSTQLTGPELDNYTGFLSAEFSTSSVTSEDTPAIGGAPQEPAVGLRVAIGQEDSALVNRIPIEITGGRDVPVVEFEVIPSMAGQSADPSRQLLAVPVDGNAGPISFSLPSVADTVDDVVFVQILQKDQVIDVLRISFGGKGVDKKS